MSNLSNLLNKIQCIDYIELLKLIPNNYIDVLITDPPFGVSYQNNYCHNKKDILINDNTNFSYTELAIESFRILKPNSAFFVFTGWSTYPKHFEEFNNAGFTMKEPLIVQKRASGTTDLYGSFQSNSDWILFGYKGRFTFKTTTLLRNKRAGTIPNKGRKPVPEFKQRFPSCWFGESYPYSTENPYFATTNNLSHPTIKTVELISWLIQLSTNKDEIILDPFAGSGTTLVAALQNNRKFIGGEIKKEFVDMCENRLSKLI